MDFSNMTLSKIEAFGYELYNQAGRDCARWKEVEACFLYLVEHCKYGTKVGQFANTLGYIYYYGRTTNFEPQYDKAYYYFTIGADCGFFESTYKLGDMYKNGYYVEQNYETAIELYHRVCDYVEEQFYLEEFDGVFADIALRLGSMYREGLGCEKDEHFALYMYTIANYTIIERMKHSDFFGNRKVKDSIEKELTELQQALQVDKNQVRHIESFPFLLEAVDMSEYACNVLFEMNEGSVIITLERLGEFYEDVPRIPVILSQYDYVKFEEQLQIIAHNPYDFEYYEDGLLIEQLENNVNIVVDDIYIDEDNHCVEFYFREQLVASIKANNYEYTLVR